MVTVTGVDASGRRVQVCNENARRLGVTNFRGVQVNAAAPLPFPNESFDGVMAAHSLEQTPDPRAALAELFRVLKPGGRLRLVYEGLSAYQGGHEREVWAWESGAGVSQLLLCQRRIEQEWAGYFTLQFDSPLAEIQGLTAGGEELDAQTVSVKGLERARPRLADAVCWTLLHPSCRTWMGWMLEAGFTSVMTTHDGGALARRMFDAISPNGRPRDLAGVDRLLRPAVAAVVRLEAPLDLDAPITAVK